MIKDIFIDVETTGLDPEKNGIIQIAGMIEIEGKIVKTFNLDCCPFPEDRINNKALAVNKKTIDEIWQYPDPLDVYKILTDTMGDYVDRFDHTDKFHFIAYNAPFDMEFLREWFAKAGSKKYFGSWFHFPDIDAMRLAAQHLKNVRASMPNFRLATVAEKLGIEIDTEATHDALYDINLTKKVYYHVTNREDIRDG